MQDEKNIIERLQKGDETAFKYVFDSYKDRIYNTILYMVQSDTEAEDLTQEVFVDVFLSIENFNAQ